MWVEFRCQDLLYFCITLFGQVLSIMMQWQMHWIIILYPPWILSICSGPGTGLYYLCTTYYIAGRNILYICIIQILIWFPNYCKSKDEAVTTSHHLHVQITTKAGGTSSLKQHGLLRSLIWQVYSSNIHVKSLEQHACGPVCPAACHKCFISGLFLIHKALLLAYMACL